MSLGDNIRSCHSCGTKKYQLPILDEAPEGDKVIMCVDYAAPLLPPSERNAIPEFDRCFPAGPMLEPALRDLARFGYTFYGSYLLKCPPLTNGVPRKPTRHEITNCFSHLLEEIEAYHPHGVLMLGQGVYMNVLPLLGLPFKKSYGHYFNIYEHQGFKFSAAPHPGSLDKQRDNASLYMEGIVNAVRRCDES